MKKIRDLLGPELVRMAEENKNVDESFFSALKEAGLIKDYLMTDDGSVIVQVKHEMTKLNIAINMKEE